MIYSFIIDRLQDMEDRLQAVEFQLLSSFFYCLNVVTTLISFAALIGFPILSGMTSWLFFTIHYGATFIGVLFLKNFKMPRRFMAGLRAGFPIAVTQWIMVMAIRELTDGMQPYKGWRQLRIADPFITWAILSAQRSAGIQRSFKDFLLPAVLAMIQVVTWYKEEFAELTPYYTAVFFTVILMGTFNYLLLIHAQHRTQLDPDELTFYHSFITFLLFLPEAIYYPLIIIPGNIIGTDKPWTVYEWFLTFIGAIMFASMQYTRYWMIGNWSTETYLTMKHVKYCFLFPPYDWKFQTHLVTAYFLRPWTLAGMAIGGLYMLSRQNWKAILHAFINPYLVLPEKRADEKD